MRFNADVLQWLQKPTDNCPRQRDHLIPSHQQSFPAQLINLEGSFACGCVELFACVTDMKLSWFAEQP